MVLLYMWLLIAAVSALQVTLYRSDFLQAATPSASPLQGFRVLPLSGFDGAHHNPSLQFRHTVKQPHHRHVSGRHTRHRRSKLDSPSSRSSANLSASHPTTQAPPDGQPPCTGTLRPHQGVNFDCRGTLFSGLNHRVLLLSIPFPKSARFRPPYPALPTCLHPPLYSAGRGSRARNFLSGNFSSITALHGALQTITLRLQRQDPETTPFAE